MYHGLLNIQHLTYFTYYKCYGAGGPRKTNTSKQANLKIKVTTWWWNDILYKADLDPDLQKKRTRTFRKSGPQTFRKSGAYTKIHCLSYFWLIFDKFEGANFKYDNSFFKILAQKYPDKAILVPNLSIFVF